MADWGLSKMADCWATKMADWWLFKMADCWAVKMAAGVQRQLGVG